MYQLRPYVILITTLGVRQVANDKPVILITGANSGMGKETAMALAKQNKHVVMMCRNKEKCEAALKEFKAESNNPDVDLLLCDLADLASVRQFASVFIKKYDRLDVLINNAGVVNLKWYETKDGFEQQFGVNHLAPFLLTRLLLPLLKKSAPSRIVVVSSAAYKFGHIQFDDLQSAKKYRTFKVYGQSKLANVLMTYELARRLKGTGVTVNAVHPGAVSTNLGIDRSSGFGKSIVRLLKPFFQTAKEGAKTAIYLATSPEVSQVSGKYFVILKEKKTTGESVDLQLAKKLWVVSEQLTGLSKSS